MQFLETVANLLGHKPADRTHAAIGLEGRAAHVERDIG